MKFEYNPKQRFDNLHMPIRELIIRLADGNVGAITVMMEMVNHGPRIDPDAAFGPWAGLLSLDSWGIYGSDIWVLYKDICGESIVKTLAVLRAAQLGITAEVEAKDVDGLLAKVQERLPGFAVEYA